MIVIALTFSVGFVFRFYQLLTLSSLQNHTSSMSCILCNLSMAFYYRNFFITDYRTGFKSDLKLKEVIKSVFYFIMLSLFIAVCFDSGNLVPVLVLESLDFCVR